jgi:hypothetical protein
MDGQINELSKGEKANSGPGKYNLWSKKKEGNSDIPNPTPRPELKTQEAPAKKGKLRIPHP